MFSFLVFSFVSNGQNKTIDSLKAVLLTQKEDTNKVNLLLKLSDAYRNRTSFDSAIIFANLALNTAKKNSFKKGEGYAYSKIAHAHFRKYDWKEVLIYYKLALEKFEEISLKTEMAQSYLNLGATYSNMENRAEGIKNLYSALKLYEEIPNRKQAAFCYISIGYTYYAEKEYEQAFNAYSNAISLCKGKDFDNNCGYAYIFIANIYRIQKRYKEALTNDSIGLKIAISAGDHNMIANAYTCMGDILIERMENQNSSIGNSAELTNLKEAYKNYLEALNYFRSSGDPGGMGDNYSRLSEINTRLLQFSKAQQYADSALQCAKEIDFKDNFEKSYRAQVKLDSALGNFRKAFESYKKYILYRDSATNEENTKRMLHEKMQYEFDKKEAVTKAEQDKKDEAARRTRNLQYFAIGIVLLIAVFLFIYSRQKQKAKTKIEKAYSDLKSTQQQLIQSEKMASLGELTAGIAHEIQNPLNFVNNFSDVNKEMLVEMNQEIEKGNYEEVKVIAKDITENEEKINHHGKRADSIVKGMLQHSRTSSGQKEPTDINALCDEYLRLAYHGLRAKDKSFNATTKTEFDNSIGKINVNPQDLGRVILNLINNAFYAVSEKQKQNIAGYEPTVTVITKKIKDKVEIRVKDNGNGIPQKILDKIFQPFFTTKPTGQGTGLGLSLAYDIIIKGHGGELKVETKEGEGSLFIIQLPIN